MKTEELHCLPSIKISALNPIRICKGDVFWLYKTDIQGLGSFHLEKWRIVWETHDPCTGDVVRTLVDGTWDESTVSQICNLLNTVSSLLL